MTREETVKNLLTELIDMIDNGSQRDLDRADEIGSSIIKMFREEPNIDKIRAEIEHIGGDDEKAFCKNLNESYKQGLKDALKVIDKYKAESEDR